MDILSLNFVILLFVTFLAYYLLKTKYRIALILIISCGFVASYNLLLLPYVLIYALVNFFIAKRIPDARNKKALHIIGIIINVSQLVLLRYASFALDPIFQVFQTNIHVSRLSEILVPVGISYFTLQGIGYLINVKMGWEKPENNFLHFILYIIYFPKYISGPIERSNHFLPQLKNNLTFNYQQVNEGIRIAFFGFFKKVAIANQLAPFLTSTYANLDTADGLSLWILLIIQPLYLYFDFSGYTDMAIGMSKMFGIQLLPNFNRPFFSENMTNFWKRFHISLSSWFNDYIFKPTVFKRRKWGINASIYALFITWILFGIWHGAGWNFMILGVLQAIAIIYEFFTKKWRAVIFSKIPDFFRKWLGRLFTYLFYACSLVFFFSPDLNTSFNFYNRILKISQAKGVFYLEISKSTFLLTIALIVVILILEAFKNDYQSLYRSILSTWQSNKLQYRLFRWGIYYIFLILIIYYGSRGQDFVYFQF